MLRRPSWCFCLRINEMLSVKVIKKKINPRRRIILLDELRGIAVFCMVFYHGFFMLSEVFELAIGDRLFYFFMPLQPFFASLFIVISGIASRLTRSNAVRGLKLFLLALLLSVTTIFILPEFGIENVGIYFGIIHFLSVAMLIFAAARPLLNKIKPEFGVIACALLYLLTYNISDGYIGISGIFRINLPFALYNNSFLYPLGFHNNSFYSADYFSVFPHIFMFLAGTFIGIAAAAGRFPQWTYASRIKFFGFLGRHTLLIYVLHQPVIYGIITFTQLIIRLLD
jgi:uncharacterized membrane protein